MALAFWREGAGRVALSFIGEGGSSLGEWHEAINLCAARRLPAVFCVENNQTALSTPLAEQSAARVFADKASGYGIPGITIDGTDADAIASRPSPGRPSGRGAGDGPALIELVCMRMCGHAHHDDMLYLGKERAAVMGLSAAGRTAGLRRPRALRVVGAEGSDLDLRRQASATPASSTTATLSRLQARGAGARRGRGARGRSAAPWPDAEDAGRGVTGDDVPRVRVEPLTPERRGAIDFDPPLPPLEPGSPFDRNGQTFLEAIATGLGDALRADPRVFVLRRGRRRPLR